MSGKIFDNTSPVKLSTLRHSWLSLVSLLTNSCGFSSVTPVGTTFKKDVMGDIDVCVAADDVTTSTFLLMEILGFDNVKKIGKMLSFRYELSDMTYAQVDLIVGNPNWISWSRNGLVEPESKFSGGMRNLFLNTVLREMTVVSHEEGLRERMSIDFDDGMFAIKQTKIGQKTMLKRWKTLEQVFISDSPDVVVTTVFGHGRGSDAVTLESCLKLFNAMKVSEEKKREILGVFIAELATDDVQRMMKETDKKNVELIMKFFMVN